MRRCGWLLMLAAMIGCAAEETGPVARVGAAPQTEDRAVAAAVEEEAADVDQDLTTTNIMPPDDPDAVVAIDVTPPVTDSLDTTAPEVVPAPPSAETVTQVAAAPKPEPSPPAAPEKPKNPSDDFFNEGRIPNLRIRLSAKEEQQLRQDQRRYVDCTLIEDETKTYKKVKVKLKGAAGSFRNLGDKAAFTLSMKKKDERFHGMDKFHLNNSVQDPSYLNELVCSQLCLEAGLPAARVTHARVWLNDQDLGFYVLKEGFDKEFLARHFDPPTGNLYDGGFCQDIDAQLEKDEGDGVDDLSDIKALIAACREPDQMKRWAAVEQKVDIDAMLNFVALEMMMCHWDGYAQNRNNYRVYFRADNGKVMFMPHGMDQMFGDPNFPVFHVPGPIVTSAVMQNPEWFAKYRLRVKQLLPNFAPDKLHAKIDTAHVRIRPVVAKMGEEHARQLDEHVKNFKARVQDRQKNILAQAPPEPIEFTAEGYALIENWEPRPTGDAKLEKRDVDGKAVLAIETGPSKQCTSSFRAKVRLARGAYRLEAKVKTIDVTPLADGQGLGAGVRMSGGMRQNQATGTSDWQTLSFPLEIGEDLREVELVAELRSSGGTALFEAASLRVVNGK